MKTRWLLVVGALTALLLAMAIGITQAQGPEPQGDTASALAPAAWYTCTPAQVGAFKNGIHVKCTAAASGGIWYFAYPTSDTANASRFLSLLSTALVAGKQVTIQYDPADTSGAAYGCLVSDCRAFSGVILLP